PPPQCIGDCDGSGNVTVDELVRGINQALVDTSAESCAAFNCSVDCSAGPGRLGPSIACLIQAVNNALQGCHLRPCQNENDCDDGNGCSADQCTPEGCVHSCVC